MSENIKQLYDAHPTTTFVTTDLMYLGRSPYGTSDDFAFTYGSLRANLAPLTTKGDILTYSTVNARLPVGTNGQFLQANSSTATGLQWSTFSFPLTPGAAGTIIRSDGTNFQNSTSTFADTYSASSILYSNGANTVTGLTTANDGVLITSGSGIPSISSTLPNAVQANITTLGTIATGVWHGSVISEIYGGTNQSSYVLGDTLYASAANTLSKLSGNTTAVKQYLSQTGTGSVSAAPSWATISGGDISGAALTKTDDTNVTLTLGGTPTTALLRATSLTLGWTGQLSVPRGGTGNSTFTAYSVLCAGTTATGAFQNVSGVGTAGQVLTSNDAGALPSWQAPAAATASVITDDTATNATVYPVWVTANSGSLPLKVTSTRLYFNPLNGNLRANNFIASYFTTVSSGTPIVLTVASSRVQAITGSSAQTVQLPDATTLTIGSTFEINNNSTGLATITNNGGTTLLTIPSGGYARIINIATSTSNGAWDWHYLMPANANYGTAGMTITGTLAAGSASQFAVNASGVVTSGTWQGTVIGSTYGGTGVNNGASTATYAGNLNFAEAFTTSGAFAVTQTYTGITNVTFPTSGTLATTAQLPTPAALTKVDDTNVTLTLGGTPATALLQATSITAGWTGQLGLTRGGTAASLTASNGGLVYSTASALAVLAAGSSGQIPRSGGAGAPTWSTATYPATAGTSGNVLTSDGTNWISSPSTGTGTVNSGTAGQLAYYAGSGTAVSGGQLGNVKGTTTNDNASAGNVEEFSSSQVTQGSATSLTVNTLTNITTLSLTAGDWNVWGNVGVLASVSINNLQGGISTTSATLPDGSLTSYIGLGAAETKGIVPVEMQRMSLASTTTIYLVVTSSFNGTGTTFGYLAARRVR